LSDRKKTSRKTVLVLKKPVLTFCAPLVMTLIETLVFMILSGALVALGHFLAGKWGSVAWLIGGVPVALFWALVMFGTARSVFIQFRQSLSPRPVCHQSKCRLRDYVLVDSTPFKAVFRCRCGDLYLSEGDRFSQILPDHSLLPYMVRDSSRSWKKDTRGTLN
jgi:hypothetical protein